MENPTENKTDTKQVCSITVMFPVTTDEGAIVVKKKIDEAVSNIENARVDFRLMDIPQHGPPLR